MKAIPRHDQRLKKICVDRRLGIPGMARRRFDQADRHRSAETMLRLPRTAKKANDYVFSTYLY